MKDDHWMHTLKWTIPFLYARMITAELITNNFIRVKQFPKLKF